MVIEKGPEAKQLQVDSVFHRLFCAARFLREEVPSGMWREPKGEEVGAPAPRGAQSRRLCQR